MSMLLFGLLMGSSSQLYQVTVHGTLGGWVGVAANDADAITQALAYFGITGSPTTICNVMKLVNSAPASGLLTLVNTQD